MGNLARNISRGVVNKKNNNLVQKIKYYLRQKGTPLQSFDSTINWTVANGAVSIDSTQGKLKITDSGTGQVVTATRTGLNFDMHTMQKNYMLELWIDDVTKLLGTGASCINIKFYDASNKSRWTQNITVNNPQWYVMKNGLNRIPFPQYYLKTYDSQVWNNLIVTKYIIEFTSAVGQAGSIILLNDYMDELHTPIIVPIFDDCFASARTLVLPLAQTYNIKFSVAVIPAKIGTANFLTAQQCVELSDSGLCEFILHGKSGSTDDWLNAADVTADHNAFVAFCENPLGDGTKKLNYSRIFCALPNGNGTTDVKNQLTALGYKVFRTTGGVAGYETLTRYNDAILARLPLISAQPMNADSGGSGKSYAVYWSDSAQIQFRGLSRIQNECSMQIAYAHDVLASGASGTQQINAADVESIFADCNTKGIVSKFPTEAMRGLNIGI